MPPGTTKAQFRAMLQNLLAERFKVATHPETKEVSGYSLVAVRNKLKIKESSGPPAPVNDGSPAALKLGTDDFVSTYAAERLKLEANKVSTQAIAIDRVEKAASGNR